MMLHIVAPGDNGLARESLAPKSRSEVPKQLVVLQTLVSVRFHMFEADVTATKDHRIRKVGAPRWRRSSNSPASN